jgi:hypothetical protein
MKELFDQLTPVLDHNEDPMYADEEVRCKATTVIDLRVIDCGRPGGLLCVLENDIHVSFVVLSFAESTVEGAQTMWHRVFHGSGPSGALRELRHTFWGDPNNAGYIFYPNAKLITEAFHHLNRWFDCD